MKKLLLLSVLVLFSLELGPQKVDGAMKHLAWLKIDSLALRGNYIGDPSVRQALVLLPPSYFSAEKRYPVVYLLHGLGMRTDGHLVYKKDFLNFYGLMEKKELEEMILVAVDGTTAFGGSYYADSPTIGNFERYVTEEIVQIVDTHFRTRAESFWRAIAGFSMGGHGAIKLGMKHSDVFGRIGSLSGSPLSMRYRKNIYKNALQPHRRPSSLFEMKQEITFEKNWTLAAAYAKAAAFSFNPDKPPFYLDLPFETVNAEGRDPIWQKWLDDDPLSLLQSYQKKMFSIDQIYIDHGDDETILGTEDFLRELIRYGIGFTYYIFRGDHADELYMRHVRMLQIFSSRWRAEKAL